ncbi:hypothetical protein [Mesorhizobium sangaii]|uniref:Uncharacterized protein n=1 Tax=Mesorhizobium sangaii TaxID=505389 RepID=A0A841PP20_9HYPH|nr:hypothetical protein [Mesorhizobium sangaii]MBB6411902.1 hypothetical protein [Mesorhizobium sangaii]
MKKLTFAIAMLLSVSSAWSQSPPIEADAHINQSGGINFPALIEPAVGMIRANGWRCDSISAMLPFLMSRGFSVTCNHYSYTYNFEDKGGDWVVSLDD